MTRIKLQLAKALPIWGQITTWGKWFRVLTKKRASYNKKQGTSKKWKRKHSKKWRRYSSISSSSASENLSPEKKKKRKKAGKKRKKHRHKKRSSSSNELDTETDFDTSPFKVVSETDKCKYNLPAKMANNANAQFDSCVKDPDIKQQILITNLAPENPNKAQKSWRICERHLKRRT